MKGNQRKRIEKYPLFQTFISDCSNKYDWCLFSHMGWLPQSLPKLPNEELYT